MLTLKAAQMNARTGPHVTVPKIPVTSSRSRIVAAISWDSAAYNILLMFSKEPKTTKQNRCRHYFKSQLDLPLLRV